MPGVIIYAFALAKTYLKEKQAQILLRDMRGTLPTHVRLMPIEFRSCAEEMGVEFPMICVTIAVIPMKCPDVEEPSLWKKISE